jgi:hypothetical protein
MPGETLDLLDEQLGGAGGPVTGEDGPRGGGVIDQLDSLLDAHAAAPRAPDPSIPRSENYPLWDRFVAGAKSYAKAPFLGVARGATNLARAADVVGNKVGLVSDQSLENVENNQQDLRDYSSAATGAGFIPIAGDHVAPASDIADTAEQATAVAQGLIPVVGPELLAAQAGANRYRDVELAGGDWKQAAALALGDAMAQEGLFRAGPRLVHPDVAGLTQKLAPIVGNRAAGAAGAAVEGGALGAGQTAADAAVSAPYDQERAQAALQAVPGSAGGLALFSGLGGAAAARRPGRAREAAPAAAERPAAPAEGAAPSAEGAKPVIDDLAQRQAELEQARPDTSYADAIDEGTQNAAARRDAAVAEAGRVERERAAAAPAAPEQAPAEASPAAPRPIEDLTAAMRELRDEIRQSRQPAPPAPQEGISRETTDAEGPRQAAGLHEEGPQGRTDAEGDAAAGRPVPASPPEADARQRELPDRRGLLNEQTPAREGRAGETPTATFRTAKGSTYEVNEGGRTTRVKAPRPEHPGDSGVKERSDETVYVDPEHARALGMHQSLSGKKAVVVRDGRAYAVSWNEQAQRWGVSPLERGGYPVSTRPEVGKAPLELWGRGEDGAYAKWHPGNSIVSVDDGAPTALGARLTLPGEASKTEMLRRYRDATGDTRPVEGSAGWNRLRDEADRAQRARAPQSDQRNIPTERIVRGDRGGAQAEPQASPGHMEHRIDVAPLPGGTSKKIPEILLDASKALGRKVWGGEAGARERRHVLPGLGEDGHPLRRRPRHRGARARPQPRRPLRHRRPLGPSAVEPLRLRAEVLLGLAGELGGEGRGHRRRQGRPERPARAADLPPRRGRRRVRARMAGEPRGRGREGADLREVLPDPTFRRTPSIRCAASATTSAASPACPRSIAPRPTSATRATPGPGW